MNKRKNEHKNRFYRRIVFLLVCLFIFSVLLYLQVRHSSNALVEALTQQKEQLTQQKEELTQQKEQLTQHEEKLLNEEAYGETGIQNDDDLNSNHQNNSSQNAWESEEEGSCQMEGTMFYQTEITPDIQQRITGKSYPNTTEPLEISYEDLAYVHILYVGFDGESKEGEIICNKQIADDLLDIFQKLYQEKYEIEQVELVDVYNADDEKSMAANNSSAFNYRVISGTTKLSNHSYGLAIDINPLYNPYVFTRNGVTIVQPDNGINYVDREQDFLHKIDHEDLCYQLFTEHGFTWGGDWKNSKDYQHFEKKIE